MKLGVMQPYFFPYIGYFELINRTDEWVVLDTVQYVRRGWMNRNRVLHPANADWSYITAPVVKHDQRDPITSIEVVAGREWKDQILRQLAHYKKWAPHYEATMDVVRRALEPGEPSLSKLNVHGLSVVCEYLGISFNPRFLSGMGLELGPIEASGDWTLRISEALGAAEYINPPGGIDLYDPAKFKASGIELTIQRLVEFPYPTRGLDYVSGLSIIDACMWNSPEEIRAFLGDFKYEAKAA